MKAVPARLDADKKAKPLTQIVHHPPAGACIGPGMPLHHPEYQDETGTRTSLYGGRGGRSLQAKPIEDYPISQLRLVEVHLCEPRDRSKRFGLRQVYMMHESQVERFMRAQIKLHHIDGNPHLDVKLDNLWEIKVGIINTRTKSYWWCTEDLQKNQDPKGAQLNEDLDAKRVWAHPDLLARESKERAAEEEEEEKYRS